MCTADLWKPGLFQFHVPTGPLLPRASRPGSAAGPSAGGSGPGLGVRAAEWAGTGALLVGPGASRKLSPASARRKEAAAEEGAPGVPGAPHLPRARPRLFSSASGSSSAHSPALAPPPPAARVRSAGPPGPLRSPRAPLPSQPLRGARARSREPHPPPDSRTRPPRGRRLRAGGRGAARLRGPGARVAPAPPAPRGLSAARGAAGTRLAPLGARAAEDAGGLPRPRPALPPGGPRVRPAPSRRRLGRSGGERLGDRLHRDAGAPIFRVPVASSRRLWTLTVGSRAAARLRGPWRWLGGAAPRGAAPGRAEPPAPPAARVIRPRGLAGSGAVHAAPEFPHR